MKRIFALVLLAVILAAGLACEDRQYAALEQIEAKNKQADEAEKRGDFEESKRLLLETEQIARDAKLAESVISAKLSLAGLESDPARSEQNYLELKKMCAELRCNRMDLINDWLFWIYVFRQKNPAKAGSIVDEVISRKDSLTGDRSFEERLRQFAAEYRGGGFSKEAADLEAKISVYRPPNQAKNTP